MACLTSAPFTTLCVMALLTSLGGCTVNIPDAESSSSEGDDDDDDGTEEGDSSSGADETSTGADETTESTTSGTSSTSSSTSTSSSSTSSTTSTSSSSTSSTTSTSSSSTSTTTGNDTETSDTEGTGVPATFETMVEIFRVACQGAGCHGGETPPELLPYDPNLYTAVMTQVSEACGGIPFVTPFEPENSAFFRILTEPCGTTPRMPNRNCSDETEENCLPPAYIEAVEQWIADGAPE